MKLKRYYENILYVGFIFFAMSMAWSVYYSFVPIFLRRFLEDDSAIGFILTLEGFGGIFLSPLFGALSDRTSTRFGKRLPYLIVLMSIGAVLLLIIPAHWNFLSLITFIILFNAAMVSCKSPGLAFAADLSPSNLMSISCTIINFLIGLGAAAVNINGIYIYSINESYAFIFVSLIIFISIVLLYKNLKESRDSTCIEREKKSLGSLEEEMVDDEEALRAAVNILLVLGTVFFTYVAYKGITAFFTTYGVQYLGLEESDAVTILNTFSVSMVIFAIPSGLISYVIGKKMAALAGLLFAVLLSGILINTVNVSSLTFLSFLAGASFTLVNINIYPLLISLTNCRSFGRFTGYYYMCTCFASVISPPLLSKLIDLFGYEVFFAYTGASFLAAFLLAIWVKPAEEALNQKKYITNFLLDFRQRRLKKNL